MNHIYVFSGPCGCGKSTLADAFAAHLVKCETLQVYVIHGDVFHRGFVETERSVGLDCPGFQYWPDILRFNWECIIATAESALQRGLDVIIDYVVEDELPLLTALAIRHRAKLIYVVLTASEDTLRTRLTHRGSVNLIDRSLFLREKLNAMLQNAGHLYDVTGLTVAQEIAGLDTERFVVTL